MHTLERSGSDERAQRLRAAFQHATPVGGVRGMFGRLGRRLLIAYWMSCLTVIVMGLDMIYPEVRPAVEARLTDLTGWPGAE